MSGAYNTVSSENQFAKCHNAKKQKFVILSAEKDLVRDDKLFIFHTFSYFAN